MHKAKLQILCQRNSWGLPEFSTTKCGLDHNPSFTATVTVNGVPFTTADDSRTSKEAHNKAAKIALDHFSPPVNPVNPYPSFPQPSGLPTTSGLDVGQLSTGISQPTMIGTIQTPLMSETLVGAKDDKKLIDMRHLYKNRLQNYAQKRNLPLPDYSTEREGPPHASRFKSKVTFDGKTYGSPEFSPTLKEAEHAAAKVALESLSDDSGLFKNLLQELAQKEGLDVPKYETNVSGPPHIPTFVSTVEIKGQSFGGQAAKSKKQAETNAAKVAYTDLQERKKLVTSGGASMVPMILQSGCKIKKALEASSSILQSVIAGDWQQSAGQPEPKANLITREEQSEKDKGVVFSGDLQQTAAGPTANLVIQEEEDKDYIARHEEKRSSNLTTANAEVNYHHAPPSPPDSDINAKRHRCSSSAEIIYASLRDPFPSSCSSPEDGFSLPLVHSESSKNSTLDSNNKTPLGTANGRKALPHEKICVYPRGPNVEYPEGATVLPFSDDKWVAMKMNPSQ
ncbi:hypothetical protein RHGRI_006762 [Rhododendron griersonianum]|uniref:DRBM domain-containing protein n=1 Tax=Rhododendron griersonianum TaxID=479676 RepID=A0AAV6KV01_9ERIC|nr:hypothetical protein RHGRI_006762 [Rhododendron griersonianum]